MSTTTKIIFNGREYSSPDEMPADDRRAYDDVMRGFVDSDHNGIPDVAEGKGEVRVESRQTTTFTVNGQQYASEEEMPEAVRRLFRGAPETASQSAEKSVRGDAVRPSLPSGRARIDPAAASMRVPLLLIGGAILAYLLWRGF